ncbi:hypothetical protein L218DRAFT_1003357 [Marasmius fiardii PR-910]|nr:hypothetical protein L218DRAFT_1003357 [Marasmius fiardii PR-910]
MPSHSKPLLTISTAVENVQEGKQDDSTLLPANINNSLLQQWEGEKVILLKVCCKKQKEVERLIHQLCLQQLADKDKPNYITGEDKDNVVVGDMHVDTEYWVALTWMICFWANELIDSEYFDKMEDPWVDIPNLWTISRLLNLLSTYNIIQMGSLLWEEQYSQTPLDSSLTKVYCHAQIHTGDLLKWLDSQITVIAIAPEVSNIDPIFVTNASRPNSEEESEQEKADCSALPHTYDVTDNKHVHLTTNREWNSCDQNQCPNALANSISEPYHLIDIDGSILESDHFLPVLPPLPLSPLPVRPVTPSLSRTPRHSRPGSLIGRHSRPTSHILPVASPAPALLPVPRGPSVSPSIHVITTLNPVVVPQTLSPKPQPPTPPPIMNNEQLAHLLEGLNTITNALLMQTTR